MRVLFYSMLLLGLCACAPRTVPPLPQHTAVVAFYNVENLFHPANDSLTRDDDRTPSGSYAWTQERYTWKLNMLARVIREIGPPGYEEGPALLGLCEVENRQVLADLCEALQEHGLDYGIIHVDSPDERGIDVALLYRKDQFIPNHFRSHRLMLDHEEGFRDHTRDQLVVNGYLGKQPLQVLVNHWPSRSGGQARSAPHRLAAARLQRRLLDSVYRSYPQAAIISMGDLNDDPTDRSVKQLQTNWVGSPGLLNPMTGLFKKGLGSLAYRDRWHLFDQLLFSPQLQDPEPGHWRFLRAGIFAPTYLRVPEGPYQGYPWRTYSAGRYSGGYSDHFPVYLLLGH